MTITKDTSEDWKEEFKQEFGIHFSKSELQFALAFIDEVYSQGYNNGAREQLDLMAEEKLEKNEIVDATNKTLEQYKDTFQALADYDKEEPAYIGGVDFGKPEKKDTSEKGWGKIKRLTVLGPAGGGGEGWEIEYCQKFGLCRDGGQDDGKCQCKAELKFISNLLSQQRKDVLQNLPEEKIIHSYMKPEEYCEGWNDYRMLAIDKLSKLKGWYNISTSQIDESP